MDTTEIDKVRAALNVMLRELDKIEQGDREAATSFCWKVKSFVDMDPGMMVQMPLWRGEMEL